MFLAQEDAVTWRSERVVQLFLKLWYDKNLNHTNVGVVENAVVKQKEIAATYPYLAACIRVSQDLTLFPKEKTDHAYGPLYGLLLLWSVTLATDHRVTEWIEIRREGKLYPRNKPCWRPLCCSQKAQILQPSCKPWHTANKFLFRAKTEE